VHELGKWDSETKTGPSQFSMMSVEKRRSGTVNRLHFRRVYSFSVPRYHWRIAHLITFIIQGVEADRIRNHHELLPDAWEKTKPRHSSRLKFTLAKAWDCDQQIFSFSAWLVGQISLSCAIEYDTDTQTCQVTANVVLNFGRRGSFEEKFADALRIVLEPSE
jgi:hypothetical protein